MYLFRSTSSLLLLVTFIPDQATFFYQTLPSKTVTFRGVGRYFCGRALPSREGLLSGEPGWLLPELYSIKKVKRQESATAQPKPISWTRTEKREPWESEKEVVTMVIFKLLNRDESATEKFASCTCSPTFTSPPVVIVLVIVVVLLSFLSSTATKNSLTEHLAIFYNDLVCLLVSQAMPSALYRYIQV